MTGITSNIGSLDSATLEKIGIKPSSNTPVAKTKETLGQSDFLRLLTTQLKNQDPLKPIENEAFVAQMAQFSAVAGIGELNTTMQGIAAQLDQSRIATATSYVGKSVLVPGGTAVPDENGEIHGALDLPADATDVAIAIRDSSGATVRTMILGPHEQGLVGFSWDGKNDAGEPVSGQAFRITAFALMAGEQEQISTNVYGKVKTVNLPTAGGQMSLEVDGLGQVDMSKVMRVRG